MRKSEYGRMSEAVSDSMSEAVHNMSENVSDTVRRSVHGRSWTWKAQRTGKKITPYEWLDPLLTIAAVALAIGSSLKGKEPKVQASFYLLSAAMMIGLDPLMTFDRILAKQSRGVIVVDVAVVILLINNFSAGMLVVALATVGASALLIYLSNDYWLSSYNWLMTETVRRSIIADPENKGMVAWTEYGIREVRTILSELGLEWTEKVLEVFAKPIYVCGFYGGYKKTTVSENRAMAAEQEMRLYKEKAENLQKENDHLTETVTRVTAEAEDSEAKYRRLIGIEGSFMKLKRMYEDVVAENQELRRSNTELLTELPAEDITAAAVQGEEELEAKLRNLLTAKDENGQNRYSIREIAEIAGVKKHIVEKHKKKIAEEMEAEQKALEEELKIVKFTKEA